MNRFSEESADREHDSAKDMNSPRIIRSEELLCGEQEVLIQHGDETYRLRLTRNGKLILQK